MVNMILPKRHENLPSKAHNYTTHMASRENITPDGIREMIKTNNNI